MLIRYNMLMNAEEESGKDFYKSAPSKAAKPDTGGQIAWTASEYIQHSKGIAWYIVAALIIIAIAALCFFIVKDIFTPVAVLIMGAILLVVSGRKPRTFSYEVSPHGIVVGSHEYTFNEFQSFGIIQEGAIESIILMPQKRWSPAINMYFSPEDGQQIFDILSEFLPFEQHERDMIDKFLHKIRF